MAKETKTVTELKSLARDIRKLALGMVYRARASHIGGALSMADMLAVLYGNYLRHNPGNPYDPERDRFLLSKGHACTTLYATLALCGYFDRSLLTTYGQDNTPLMAHASTAVPGVEWSTGSLGHALPVATGIALAGKRQKQSYKTVVMLSDGELDEGSNWEALLLAPQLQLGRLIVLVDYNKIQSLGSVREVIDLEPLQEKFERFGWQTCRFDGHDIETIQTQLFSLDLDNCVPKLLLADTIKGKGVSYMENQLAWHYRSPSKDQFEQAIHELENSL